MRQLYQGPELLQQIRARILTPELLRLSETLFQLAQLRGQCSVLHQREWAGYFMLLKGLIESRGMP